MTDAQFKAICNALSYLVAELTPVPKTTDKKQKRKEILVALSNAHRIRVGAEEMASGQQPTAGQLGASQPSNEPQVLRMEMLMPDAGAPLRDVRPETVFGTPKTGTDGWAVDEGEDDK